MHLMVTHFCVETNRPTQRLNLHVSYISPLPKSYSDAFNDPNWKNVMSNKYNALIKKATWILMPRPTDANIVRCMWLFCHKYLEDGTRSRYKARLVANGSTHVEGINVDQTFSLVVKPDTIQTVFSLATSRHWPVHYLDVKNAYLHEISLWAKTSPLGLGFSADYCFIELGVSMIDFGLLNYFLGVYVTRDSSWMFLSHWKYAVEILERAHMVNCIPSQTPIDTKSKLGDDGDPVSDPTLYRSLAGSLQYLTSTRPDISYAMQHICLYMHDPREPHFSALKRILSHVRGTLDYGLQLFSSSSTSLVAYSDADWAGFPTTRRSTLEAAYCGVANAVAETCWLRNLLRELHTSLSFATLVYCDNVRVLHVQSRYQYADIFTK
uniref:Ribonuclease H-like domain-containing protein n=1 Tax=Tanacetum cinerariifolium TaxID=118510 RepID=A0A6L2N1Z7_TANCI|nr:ribonuclease H-like domain-containing protein [Tanacetum cinerariifolium]